MIEFKKRYNILYFYPGSAGNFFSYINFMNTIQTIRKIISNKNVAFVPATLLKRNICLEMVLVGLGALHQIIFWM